MVAEEEIEILSQCAVRMGVMIISMLNIDLDRGLLTTTGALNKRNTNLEVSAAASSSCRPPSSHMPH